MSCNSCNRNMSSAYGTANSRNSQMYRSSQLARNQQMYRSGGRNMSMTPMKSDHDHNCKDEQSEDYRHPTCDCAKDSCNQASAPVDSMMIAMAYVPWQQWEEIFDYEKALCTGTIFKNLDKPWTGRACD